LEATLRSKVVVICGKANSGKSTLIRTFFGRKGVIAKGKIVRKVVRGRQIFAVGDTSPQEQNEFCKVSEVRKDIQKRLDLCDEQSGGKDYILILPFTIARKNGRNDMPNTDCIQKPIEWLRNSYKVKVVYLRKMDYADIMMRSLADQEIQSVEGEKSRQTKELREIISAL